ncbi:MAG: hypothetical protein IJS96_08905 [Schwartzia sp.]|nr:hypothetical protein [Schwartzia sp. (in: firmicutes)]
MNISPDELESLVFSAYVSYEKAKDSYSHSLPAPALVLRDHLGLLAIRILEKRHDIGKMDTDAMLRELLTIIENLHSSYDAQHIN